MKILTLRFKNINSLYGEWLIDFRDPEYSANGIFALTGPTGAGKSTVLDAICLALYGETPRLGKITKSDNEIMSRHTGECYAEVVFDSHQGQFCCHWSQHRAHKRANGKLADTRHEISDAKTQCLIETKKRAVSEVIEEKTGMDFARFTRSILLAQGSFDTFLKSPVGQKSKMLEQITGTEIYSNISQSAHEHQREEKEKLDLLKAATEGIEILDEAAEQQMRLDLLDNGKQLKVLDDLIKKNQGAIDWLSKIKILEEEMQDLSKNQSQLDGDMAKFKNQRVQLTDALKAAELESPYATLIAVRRQQNDDQESLSEVKKSLPSLKSVYDQKSLDVEELKQQTLKKKGDAKQEAELIRQVRAIDQTMSDQEKRVIEVETLVAQSEKTVQSNQKLKLQVEEEIKNTKAELDGTNKYFKANAQDEWLVNDFAGLRERLNHLPSKQDEVKQIASKKKQFEDSLGKLITRHKLGGGEIFQQQKTLDELTDEIKECGQVLQLQLGDSTLREYRTEKEFLLREMAFVGQITQLKDHRSELAHGKPCPLCGAKEHPFVDQQSEVPLQQETEANIKRISGIIEQAEEQDKKIQKLKLDETAATQQLANIKQQQAVLGNEKQSIDSRLLELKESLNSKKNHLDALEKAFLERLAPFGIATLSNVSDVIESLQQRLERWKHHTDEKTTLEKRHSERVGERERLASVLEAMQMPWLENQNRLKELRQDHCREQEKRFALFGEKNTGDEERRWHSVVETAESVERAANQLLIDSKQAMRDAENKVLVLQQQIEPRERRLASLEGEFLSLLESVGFSDEMRFCDARLTAEQRQALLEHQKVLDDRQTTIKAKQEDRSKRLLLETEKQLTKQSLETLETQQKESKGSNQKLQDIIGGLEHQLKQNDENKGRIKEKKKDIEFQRKICLRWGKLHELIGSSDGKKYRNFAQGLTFDSLVSHANYQLQKMTDRYSLVHSAERPLELNVTDYYQAEEVRSTKNLSGGEMFLVSLSLALGLSKMASRKVRVDSLFLDEGFGTLDEDTLETAFETLCGLQQEGKLIGVISHVASLKDRISAQITVTPGSDGKSRLSGPGCGPVSDG